MAPQYNEERVNVGDRLTNMSSNTVNVLPKPYINSVRNATRQTLTCQPASIFY